MAVSNQLLVNGGRHTLELDPARTLLSVLRDDLDLTGTKYGCGEGQCGACTVLLDGRPVRACKTSAADCAGKAITTIEGLEHDGRLHPVQEAFLEVGALQCGYCTPGMILAGVALLDKNPDPTPEEVVTSLQGHICRCGTYGRIVQAVRRAAGARKGGGR